MAVGQPERDRLRDGLATSAAARRKPGRFHTLAHAFSRPKPTTPPRSHAFCWNGVRHGEDDGQRPADFFPKTAATN